jgi:hypothetical protein
VGLRRFRPHLPHNTKKTEVNCGFWKVVGQVGLARASHMEGKNFFLFTQQQRTHLNTSPLGNNGDSRPHLPQTFIFCGFYARYPKIAKPHFAPPSVTSDHGRDGCATGSSERLSKRVNPWLAGQIEHKA